MSNGDDLLAASEILKSKVEFITCHFKMWMKVIFLLYILSQIFIKTLICNLVTSGFYYTQTSQVLSSVTDRENVLSEIFFRCGLDAGCTHVARSASKGFTEIKSRTELEGIKDDESLWSKSIGKEPGK